MMMIRVLTRLRALALLLGAGATAGCMQLAPVYERPAAPVPGGFPNATALGSQAADLPWPSYFTDPTLQSRIKLALANNRDLRIAALNIEAAQAQFQLRRADELPTVGAGVSAGRQPGSDGKLASAYAAGLTISAYELDVFRRVASLSEAAAAQLLATEEMRKAVQIALIASVANLHLALTADDEGMGLTRRTLASRQESMKLAQLKFDHGAVSQLEVSQAQTLVEAGRIALTQQLRQRDLNRNALALLVGQALPATPNGETPLDDNTLADVPAGLPSEVLLRRPDVVQAEQLLVAAHANIGAARAALWPRITLTSSIGTASSQLSELFRDGVWSFAAQLLQPIFDSGRNRANVAVAEIQRDVALAQYERAIQAAFREVADALAGRATLADQLRATRAQEQAEQARLRLVRIRFTNGVSSSLELLDAERSVYAIQQAVVQTRLGLLQNRVALYRALGGGWDR